MQPQLKNLKFRCTGCGNCCKVPVLPLTADDIQRVTAGTGVNPTRFVRFKDRHSIDMDEEPEAFALVRQGKRVAVMRQGRNGCHFLGADNRCSIYEHRPLGCRVFPFDADYGKDKKLRKLTILNVTDCPYELDGQNSARDIVARQEQYNDDNDAYYARVEDWNRLQRSRKRRGQPAQSTRSFLEFLGVLPPAKDQG